MWHCGLFLLVIHCLAAYGTETEISMEAAFQGRCNHGSPCEQLCYELHDGMYECDCTDGYELQRNGYSCQEINSTLSSTPEDNPNIEEDILYQKGASFSAKLDETNTHIFDNSLNDNDLSEKSGNSNKMEKGNPKSNNLNKIPSDSDAEHLSNEISKMSISGNDINSRTVVTVASDLNGDNFYSKEDMSVYDDVNNNRLNLRNIDIGVYPNRSDQQNRKADFSDSLPSPVLPNGLTHSPVDYVTNGDGNVETTTQSPTGIGQLTAKEMLAYIDNVTDIATTLSREPCLLDCGIEGACDNSIGISRCLCPFGKTGVKCEEDLKISIPRFTKRSWIAFPALRGAYKHVQLHIELRPESFDGIILLTGERDDLTGDFMALLIHQGFIEFWFDCGSGTGKVKSEETVVLNQWNSVTVYRHRWDAWLQLNQGNRVQGRSKGLFSRITFREPVFLGGTGNITGLAKKLPILDGMVGCIRKFIANEHEYEFGAIPFGDVTQGFDVQECTTDRCSRYPCRHGGKCLPSDQGAICLCPLGFGGDLCEMRLDLQVPSFNGSSYLRFAPLGDTSLIWLELKIIIKPQQEDGLILYSGHHEYGDYISLCLNMGHIEFTYDLGSGPATVRSEFPLTLGQWHTVKISRTARLAVLKIDQLPEIMTISPNGFWHLSLPHSLFLGGVHNIQTLPLSLREKGSFVGCIQKVEINGRPLLIISEALGGSNVDNCPHACVARPCGPLAKCIPNLENYECQCNPSNAQCNKAEEVTSTFVEKVERNKFPDNPIILTSTKIPIKEFIMMPKWENNKNRNFDHSSVDDRPDYNEKDSDNDDNNYYEYTDEDTDNNDTKVSDDEDDSDNDDDDDNEDDFDDYNIDEPDKNDQSYHDNLNINNNNNNEKTTSATYSYAGLTDNRSIKISRVEVDDNNMNNDDADDTSGMYMSVDTNELLRNDELPSSGKQKSKYKKTAKIITNIVTELNSKDNNSKLAKDEDKSKTARTNTGNIDKQDEYPRYYSDDLTLTKSEFIDDMDRIMKERKGSVSEKNNKNNNNNSKMSYNNKREKSKSKTIRKDHGACFTGTDSYFHYSDAETMRRIISYKIDLNLRFKSHSSHGLILWSGRHTAMEGDDFLLLGIENGHLHLRYNLGSGEVNIIYNATKVSDGLWHRIRAIRNLQEGSLEVDGGKPIIQRSPGKLRQLNTDAGLYVGGMPDAAYYTRRKYNSGILGCISEVILAGELRLNLDSAVLGTAHNVELGGVL